ncbi:hypothetical protein [Olivibacter sp. XZL3]|uniref:hypothetical protein n=1 Tax=Olivibacter sp. XZL3 TaxID=1735116 RepID=UPI001064FB6F|nr:hypothetical protein [Olivibacter sp. XZL3]
MEINLDRKLIDELIIQGYTVLVSEKCSAGNYCLVKPKKWDLEAWSCLPSMKSQGDEEIIFLDDLLFFNCNEFSYYRVVS